jgi:bifunctional non-homologous end joining protein LigD
LAELDLYHAKRDFRATREPRGARLRRKAASDGGVFVIQKHAARSLHYDLRLEHDGVLWSWAVTRGPSLDPSQKRLAVHVEDHPFDYRNFEGLIPKGQYGGGSVIVWDEGKWLPRDEPAAGMKKGHLSFELKGHKLSGLWHLVRLKPRAGEKRENWLLTKADDEAARPGEDILETKPNSVKSGLSVEQVGAGETTPAGNGAGKLKRQAKTASFHGLREDKSAQEVAAEKPSKTAPARSARRGARGPAAAEAAGGESAVKLTHADKVLWPDVGVTKGQLLAYYEAVWPKMRPYVIERPLSLVRAPNGVKGQRFFQKHASPGLHRSIAVVKDSADGEDLLFIRDFDGLAALVQLGVVEIHIWGCKINAIETPDQIVFDLDPDEGLPLERIRSAALAIRDRLKELGLESFPKTSGGKGFHIVAPLKPKADWERIKTFAHEFARAMEQQDAKAYTATLAKVARKGRIFIDYLRNGRGATAVAPYSSRANAVAAVSMPISWTMVEQGAAPGDFNIPGVLSAKMAIGNAWASFAKSARPLNYSD